MGEDQKKHKIYLSLTQTDIDALDEVKTAQYMESTRTEMYRQLITLGLKCASEKSQEPQQSLDETK